MLVGDQDLIEHFNLARKDQDLVVIEGFHALKHALRFKAAIVEVVAVDTTALEKLASTLAPDLSGRFEKLLTVSKEIFKQLAPKPPRTGVIALAKRPKVDIKRLLDDKRAKPIVLLENPRNLANVGACVRVAAATDAAGLLTIGTNDPWHPDAVRCSAGLHFALPVARTEELPKTNRPLVALDPSGQELQPKSIPPRAILVFGSERYGLSQSTLEHVDKVISLPMRKGVSSLNLATSLAAVLYGLKLSGVRSSVG